VKARKVKGIDTDGPLADNAVRIIATRLDELHSFSAAVRDPDAVEELHDMRIAAKRLRYVLEMTAPAFGAPAKAGAKAAKKLQDTLGEIHDCDEFVPRVEAHMAKLRAEDAATLRRLAGARAKDLDPAVAREAPNRRLYRGLEALDAYLRARRVVLYERFLREWQRLGSSALAPILVEQLRGTTIGAQDGRPDG
jgi:CHAD domain-containing protein